MEAISFRHAMQIAEAPRSRFFFGSPCRFVPRCDFTCHVLIPSLMRLGNTSDGSLWDRGRVAVSVRLNKTSPRWQNVLATDEWSMA